MFFANQLKERNEFLSRKNFYHEQKHILLARDHLFDNIAGKSHKSGT